MQYTVTAVQVAGIDNPARIVRVVRQALTLSGETLFGRFTPDGYNLEGASWISTGQLANRLAIAENVTGLKSGQGAKKVKAQRGKDMQRAGGAASMGAAKQPAPAQRALFMTLAGPGFMYRRSEERR